MKNLSSPLPAWKAFLFFAATSSVGWAGQVTPVVDVVYIGDSITYGVGLKQSPPQICSTALESKLNGTKVYFSNQGHSGHTTVDFLPGGKDFTGAEDAARQLAGTNPGTMVFSIMLGTNDSAVHGPHGAPVSPDQYGTNLTAIIDRLLADFPGSQVVLQQPTWYSPNTHNGAIYDQAGLDRLNSYFPVIASVVSAEATTHPGQVHAGDRAAYSYFKANAEAELQPQHGKEGIFHLHPNAKGAESLGNFWATAIAAGLEAGH